jgi:hypothetical protein
MQKESTAAILAISRLVFPKGKSSSGPELRLRKRTLNQLLGILLKLSKEKYSWNRAWPVLSGQSL